MDIFKNIISSKRNGNKLQNNKRNKPKNVREKNKNFKTVTHCLATTNGK